jgi:hypothetical protein
MPSFHTATVTAILLERAGLQRVDTTLGRAYALTRLTGPVEVGDDVVLNTTAVDLGLGTGGWHVVHWNLARPSWSESGPGHILKLRYTSLQCDTGAAEEVDGSAADLHGTPVVACVVHSQVPCVVAAARHARPDVRVAYVMTDGAALPLALSDLIATMVERGLLVGTVTAGQAFGGDLEAVSLPSALALAKSSFAADIVVAGMGPGVVGTGTSLGTTAVEAAAILDSGAALGGDPILAVRASDADPRERHQGLSHHTRTVLRLVRSPVTLAVPARFPVHEGDGVEPVDVPDMADLLERADLHVTTMGRGPDADPMFFACAGAAGVLAASRVGR